MSSDFVRKKKFLKYDDWYHLGFDKSPETSLYVECVKVKDVNYSYEKEYDYNKGIGLRVRRSTKIIFYKKYNKICRFFIFNICKNKKFIYFLVLIFTGGINGKF